MDPHLTHNSYGPSEPTTQTASRSMQAAAVFAGLISVTDGQTDRQTTLLVRLVSSFGYTLNSVIRQWTAF